MKWLRSFPVAPWVMRGLALWLGFGWIATGAGTRVSCNFVGGSAAYGTPAPMDFKQDYGGVVRQRFWNNAPGSRGSLKGLYGDDGGSQVEMYFSGMTVSWAAPATGSNPLADAGGQSRVMKGFLQGSIRPNGISVTISDVTAVLTNQGFVLIALLDATHPGADRVARVTVTPSRSASQTVYVLDRRSEDFAGTFQQAPATSQTDLGGETPDGNFVVFGPFHDPAVTLEVSASSSSDGLLEVGLNAVQLISTTLLALPPSIRWVGPKPGTAPWACTPVTLQVDANGNGRSVARVEFFDESRSLGVIQSAPYRLHWKTDAPGIHNLYARATDTAGYSTTTPAWPVEIALPPLHVLISYGIREDGACEICLQGEGSHDYTVLATPDVRQWGAPSVLTLGTMQRTNGLLIFRDPGALARPARFYRARQE